MSQNLPIIPPGFPNLTYWPVGAPGPDCPYCFTDQPAAWLGLAHGPEFPDRPDLHLWKCGACRTCFTVRAGYWPVLDGPDCPVCETPATRWQAIDPDHTGDRWVCEAGHEFVLDPEGFIYLPPAPSAGGEVA